MAEPNERGKAIVHGFAKGIYKSARDRFGEERAKQVLTAVKGLAETLRPPDPPTPEPEQADLDDLQKLADEAKQQVELAELQRLAEETPEEPDISTDNQPKEKE